MPRNSLASLYPGKRPPPPATLRPDMQELWRKIVNRMPADWFGLETQPVLEELCRTICYARGLGAWLDKVDPAKLEPSELPKFKMMSSQRARCTTLMAMLANKLRLTVISQRDVRNSRAMMGTDPMSPHKPWNDDASPPCSPSGGVCLIRVSIIMAPSHGVIARAMVDRRNRIYAELGVPPRILLIAGDV
jgi:hypothetical protein